MPNTPEVPNLRNRLDRTDSRLSILEKLPRQPGSVFPTFRSQAVSEGWTPPTQNTIQRADYWLPLPDGDAYTAVLVIVNLCTQAYTVDPVTTTESVNSVWTGPLYFDTPRWFYTTAQTTATFSVSVTGSWQYWLDLTDENNKTLDPAGVPSINVPIGAFADWTILSPPDIIMSGHINALFF